jgi:DNA-binding GntR family transcriptional regulator
MAPTPLTRQIAARIIDYIREEQAPQGTRLVERTLADHLRVSRSPVRSALRLLQDDGIVATTERGGYTVLRTADQLDHVATTDEADTDAGADEPIYLQIAADRLDGHLPDRITENAMARRYDLAPAQLARILRRISAEGWLERLPGYGWEFQHTLTSPKSYEDSYRFRLIIEPAAIQEPGFVVDRHAIEQVRAQQQELVDGRIWDIGNAELFDLNRSFHEAIIACSGNTFLIDALARVDNLRRLVEYRKSLARDRAVIRCREHVVIADLLLADDVDAATEYMRVHLRTVGREKTSGNGSNGARSISD